MQDPNLDLLHQLFPEELFNYFNISEHQILCSVAIKEEYWLIDFEEKNELPSGVYFIKMDFGDKHYTKSVVKSK